MEDEGAKKLKFDLRSDVEMKHERIGLLRGSGKPMEDIT